MAAIPCPVGRCCETCGGADGLTAAVIDTPVGSACTTLCGACRSGNAILSPTPLHRLVDAVLLHTSHATATRGSPLDEQ